MSKAEQSKWCKVVWLSWRLQGQHYIYRVAVITWHVFLWLQTRVDCPIPLTSRACRRSRNVRWRSTFASSTPINRPGLESCCCAFHRWGPFRRRSSNSSSLSVLSARPRSKPSSEICCWAGGRSVGHTCPCSDTTMTVQAVAPHAHSPFLDTSHHSIPDPTIITISLLLISIGVKLTYKPILLHVSSDFSSFQCLVVKKQSTLPSSLTKTVSTMHALDHFLWWHCSSPTKD